MFILRNLINIFSKSWHQNISEYLSANRNFEIGPPWGWLDDSASKVLGLSLIPEPRVQGENGLLKVDP